MGTYNFDRNQVLNALREVLDQDALISDSAGLRPYECDGLTAIREQPWVVVLPANEAQVAAVLQICREHQVPIVPRGAGTGLSGGARPHADGVVLSLARLQKILEIDPHNCVARIQPGVRNLAISQAVAEYGLYYAPDPSSQIACSIGGNVAENSGGVHCLKYGLTVNNVTGLRVLTINGEILNLGGATLEMAGFDLLALLCGSEGMLGVVTEVTVKLLPKPPSVAVMLAAFEDMDDAAAAVSDVIADGIIPAGMEMMDKPAISAAEAFAKAGYPLEAEAILLIELDGMREEVGTLTQRVGQLVREAGAYHVDTAYDPVAQQRLWKGRKSAFPAVGRLAPDYYCMDGTIPRRRLGDVLRRIAELSQEYELPVANVFHAGDGNLHPLILFDANIPGQLEATEEMGGKILETCVQMGGTVTGEHGVGVEKLDQMCVQFGRAELEQFFRVKHSWDPHGLLNPGKGVPTLTRCGEIGGHFGSSREHKDHKHGSLPQF